MDVAATPSEEPLSADAEIPGPVRAFAWFMSTFLVTFFGIYFSVCWFRWPYSGYIAGAICAADLARQWFGPKQKFSSAEDLFPDHDPKPEKLPLFGKIRFAVDTAMTFSVIAPVAYFYMACVLEKHNLGCIPGPHEIGILRPYIASARGCAFYLPAFILNMVVLGFGIVCALINLAKLKLFFVRGQRLWFQTNRKLDNRFSYQLLCAFPSLLMIYCFYFTVFGPGIPSHSNFRIIDYPYLVSGIGLNLIFLAFLPLAVITSILIKCNLNKNNYKYYLTQLSIIQQWSEERSKT